MQPWKLGAILATCLVASIAIWALISNMQEKYSEASTIAKNVRSFEELSERFAELARQHGGQYAFEVLLRADLPPNTDAHLLGHSVGNVLYAQKGISGMADCTAEFRNACSHAIVINALYEFGEDILPKVREACHDAPGGSGAYTMCFHGFGHGVFTFFKNDLKKTVAYCKKTGTPEYNHQEYSECVGGAVMELMGLGGSIEPANIEAAQKRYLTGPLEPCMGKLIPDDVKSLCLMYLTPHIWDSVGIERGNPDPALFGKAFDRCDTIPTSKPLIRKACFGSFGKEFDALAAARDVRDLASLSDASLRQIASWCSASKPDDGKAYCIDSAVGSLFWGGENDPRLSFRFCSQIETLTLKQACYQGLAEQIAIYIAPEKRKPLCAMLPADIRPVCDPKHS